MKRLFINATVFLLALLNLQAQQPVSRKIHAKQPKIMVVPSMIYCNRHGYVKEFNDQGEKVVVEDYDALFRSDENMRQVIAKINEMIRARGYTKIADLESALRKLNKDQAYKNVFQSKTSGSSIRRTPLDLLKEQVKADIIIDVDFDVKNLGARKYIHFNIKGVDAYTSEQISTASGDGEPSFAATTGVLLEEAVLSHIDNFLAQLQDYFNELFDKGRRIKLVVTVLDMSDVDLEEEYQYEGEDTELGDIIESWLEDHAVEGRMDVVNSTENIMETEIRIPLFYEKKNGRRSALTAKKFARQLVKFLKSPPFNLIMKLDSRGLGEAWIFIGEK